MPRTLELIETHVRARGAVAKLVDLVLESATPHTARAYRRPLEQFVMSGKQLSKLGVESFLATLGARHPASQAQALAAIKKLANAAHEQQLISDSDWSSVASVRLARKTGSRLGRWLTSEQVKRLYALPDRKTITGKRDAAIMALLVGCGLRREEASQLTVDRYQERDGRMCLVDVWGKGSKQRTVPVPARARLDLEAWLAVLHQLQLAQASSFVLRRTPKSYTGIRTGINGNGIWFVVREYARELGVEFSPHDLRRSMARLMRTRGVPIEQVQLVLGHASVQTTERYIAALQELQEGKAATDFLELA